MDLRDRIFLLIGTLVTLGGIVSTLTLGVGAGIVSLLVLGLFIVLLILLQRRQTAKIQERLLSLLRRSNFVEKGSSLEDSSITVKKLFGLLQAQQVSMEHLHRTVLAISSKDLRSDKGASKP